jgi:HK97 gp10 family phage protein
MAGFNGGRQRLSRKLKALPEKAKVAAVSATLDAAHEIAELQYKLAPVDTGALRNSIDVTPPGGHTPLFSQGGRRKAGETEAIITAGNAAVRYAHIIEFGTRTRQAHPFFYPGYRALKKPAKAKIARAIRKALKAAAK